jgi:hypothetical protein
LCYSLSKSHRTLVGWFLYRQFPEGWGFHTQRFPLRWANLSIFSPNSSVQRQLISPFHLGSARGLLTQPAQVNNSTLRGSDDTTTPDLLVSNPAWESNTRKPHPNPLSEGWTGVMEPCGALPRKCLFIYLSARRGPPTDRPPDKPPPWKGAPRGCLQERAGTRHVSQLASFTRGSHCSSGNASPLETMQIGGFARH